MNVSTAITAFTIPATYSGLVASNDIITQTGGLLITAAQLPVIQGSTYSTWDLTWFNWPSGSGLGAWYYYCPDVYCPSNLAGWTLFGAPNSYVAPTSMPNVPKLLTLVVVGNEFGKVSA